MFGATSLMVTLTYATDEPPELFAQMVYCVLERTMLGVPLISPFAELKVKAEPGDGEISHEVMVPPLLVGPMLGLIATFLVPVMSLLE